MAEVFDRKTINRAVSTIVLLDNTVKETFGKDAGVNITLTGVDKQRAHDFMTVVNFKIQEWKDAEAEKAQADAATTK